MHEWCFLPIGLTTWHDICPCTKQTLYGEKNITRGHVLCMNGRIKRQGIIYIEFTKLCLETNFLL